MKKKVFFLGVLVRQRGEKQRKSDAQEIKGRGKERRGENKERGEVGKVQGKGKGRESVGLFGGVGFLMLQERREGKG